MSDFSSESAVGNEGVSAADYIICLLKYKWLIVGVVALGTIIAMAYLLMAPDRYKTTSRVLPPPTTVESLLAISDYINTSEKSVENYSADDVFDLFVKNFNSQQYRREFFDSQGLAANLLGEVHDEQLIQKVFLKQFSEALLLRKAGKGGGATRLTFFYNDALKAKELLGRYIAYIGDITVEEVFADVSSKLNARKQLLEKEIQTRLYTGKSIRTDQIARLNEAVEIANSLGIQDSSQSFVIDNGNVGVDPTSLTAESSPLYLRGTKALNAELKVLLSRKDDAPFIPGLRQLEEELMLIKSVDIQKNDLKSYVLDQPADMPERPDNKPKASLLLLGAMVGLILSLVMVFARVFWLQVKERQEQI